MEEIIISVIVGGAAFITVMKLVRMVSGKDAGCGSCAGCSKVKEECEASDRQREREL